MKDTLVVNLFGEPGSGKSTGAAYIFAKLKMVGVDAELVTEFAKDKVWEQNSEVFKNQMYILGKQSFRLNKCKGKVDVLVTDSPLPLSTLYVDDAVYKENYCKTVMDVFSTYNNVNYLLRRSVSYQQNGRNESEVESAKLANDVVYLLNSNNINYTTVTGSEEGYNIIFRSVLDKLRGMQK